MANANQTSRANSTKMTYVACKLIHGLTMEIFHARPAPAPVVLGGMINPALDFRPPPVRASITLKGANSVKNELSMRGLAQPNFEYAITAVPQDFWDEWLSANTDKAFIRNGFVFALDREREVIAEGKNRASERTGLEPMAQEWERDPRVSKVVSPEARVTEDAAWLKTLNSRNGR